MLRPKLTSAKTKPKTRSKPISQTPPPPPGAMVLTIAQAADAMQCCRPTVYKRIREGAIRAYRVGDVVRIDPESVRQFLFSAPIPSTDGRKLAG